MSVVELLRKHNIRVATSAAKPDEVQIPCPFCGDNKLRLYWNVRTNKAICFNCEFRSNNAGKRLFYALFGGGEVWVPDSVYERATEPSSRDWARAGVDWPPGFVKLLPSRSLMHERAVRYILRRGFSKAEMRLKYLGFTERGKWRMRIIFPCIWRGKLRMFTGRAFADSFQPKYLNSIGDKWVYNLPEECRHAILSEGCLKAIAIERVLDKPSGALMGTNVTPLMAWQLGKAGVKRVTVWPDPDAPGIAGAFKAADQLLEYGFAVKIIWPPPEAQADEMTEAQIRRAWARRVPFSERLRLGVQLSACGIS